MYMDDPFLATPNARVRIEIREMVFCFLKTSTGEVLLGRNAPIRAPFSDEEHQATEQEANIRRLVCAEVYTHT